VEELCDPCHAAQRGCHVPECARDRTPVTKERCYNSTYTELAFGSDVEQTTLEGERNGESSSDIHCTLDKQLSELARPG
jgi:hypothetical protein